MTYRLQGLIDNMLALVDEKPERDLPQTQEVVRFGSFSYTASVRSMEMMSHIIEDAVIDSPGEIELLVSFQKMSRVKNQLERYTRVAQSARRLLLAGEIDWQVPAWPRVEVIDTANDPMIDYWFVVAEGGGVHMALLAQEVSGLAGQRNYKGFFTLDRAIARKVAATIRDLLGEKRAIVA
jgi:DICT domain-containing protein